MIQTLQSYKKYLKHQKIPFQEDGTGASIVIFSFFTGCMREILLACRDIPPSGFERGAPYFRSPFMGEPIFDS